jgi:hypothetical protein
LGPCSVWVTVLRGTKTPSKHNIVINNVIAVDQFPREDKLSSMAVELFDIIYSSFTVLLPGESLTVVKPKG